MAALHELFGALQTAVQGEDFEEAIKLSQKVLTQTPNDPDALSCLVVSLIQSGRFSEALEQISSPEHAKTFFFERCYILYREKKFAEALELLKNAPDADRFLELKAQVFYAMEMFKEAEEFYASMVLKRGTAANSDLVSNLAAVYVKTGNIAGTDQLIAKYPTFLDTVYELVFNVGTIYLANRDFSKAEQYLKSAQTICQTDLVAQDFSEEEIATEVAPILAQLKCLEVAKAATSATPQVSSPTSAPATAAPPPVPQPKAPKKSKYDKDPNAPPKPWVEKPKKTVKRKNKPPKNLDPSKVADPERWKPKYERAGYKPRRVKGRMDHDQGNRGAQGSVSASLLSQTKGVLPPIAAPASPAAPAAAPVQTPPVVNKPTGPTQAQRGKKKGGRGRR